jgi:hypothetical protein
MVTDAGTRLAVRNRRHHRWLLTLAGAMKTVPELHGIPLGISLLTLLLLAVSYFEQPGGPK